MQTLNSFPAVVMTLTRADHERTRFAKTAVSSKHDILGVRIYRLAHHFTQDFSMLFGARRPSCTLRPLRLEIVRREKSHSGIWRAETLLMGTRC